MPNKLAEAIQEQIDNALREVRETSRQAIEAEQARIAKEEKDRQEAERARIEAEKPDIFDSIDAFDLIDGPKLKAYEAPPRVALQLTEEIRALIHSEIAKLAPKEPKEVIHTREIVREMKDPPEKVIVKEVDAKALEKAVAERLASAMKDYEKNWKNIAPIVVPSPIPNQEGQGGKVLSTDGRQTKWVSASTGGGSSTDAYSTSHVSTLRTLDATNTSLDDLANILGSLIASLQGAGIIQ